jgi:hypothetical protein
VGKGLQLGGRGLFLTSKDVRPEDFTRLRKGGKENNFIVDVYLFQGGRQFSSGKTWIKTSFRQMV